MRKSRDGREQTRVLGSSSKPWGGVGWRRFILRAEAAFPSSGRGHGMATGSAVGCCVGLKMFVGKVLPARGEIVESSFFQPIKCMEN